MKNWLLIISLLFFGKVGASTSDAEQFESGVAAYEQGEFDKAKSIWEAMSKRSAALDYNLGNAYYQLGNLGKTILHYERALVQNPQDEDVINNLQLATEARIDAFEIVPEPFYKRISKQLIKVFSLQTWTILALIFLFVGAVSFVGFLFLASYRKATLAVFLGSFFLGILFLGATYARYHYVDQAVEWVVMQPNIYVKSGPQASATDVFILHEGTKALQLEANESWIKLRMPDGKIGWTEKAGLERI